METQEDSARLRPQALLTARAFLFVVFEGQRPLAGGARFALDGIDEVIIGRDTERRVRRETRDGVSRLVLGLPSPLLSSLHARLRRGPDGWVAEDTHSKNGTYVNARRLAGEPTRLGPGDLVELGHAFIAIREFPQRASDTWPDLDSSHLDNNLLGFQTLLPPVAIKLDELRRIAPSQVTVLLWGETGTGKEVLARSIHELSGRAGPFVAVNCSTLMDGLAESQLFGHVRGAFSGAVNDSVGFVRAASTGTLLLDEVGDLARTCQGTLLRVLQEHEVSPVGSARAHKIDVRFVATSPRALDPVSRRDQFRSDLFARLSGFVHEMTPLRERREDLGLLLAAVLRKAGITPGDRPRISPELGMQLLRYQWPLNIREFEQVLVRSWLLAEDGQLNEGQMPKEDPADALETDGTAAVARAVSPADTETRRQLLEALRQARGNVSEAARALGKGRVQFHRLMRRLSVDPRPFRGV